MQVSKEMDVMLGNFLVWQDRVTSALESRGHWSAAVDPRSGYPLNGTRAERWNEVEAARQLLGIRVVQEDTACPLSSHPSFGMSSKTISVSLERFCCFLTCLLASSSYLKLVTSSFFELTPVLIAMLLHAALLALMGLRSVPWKECLVVKLIILTK